MQLSEICLKRPVFAVVLNLIIVVFGILSYQQLAVQEYPPISRPVAFVNTSYNGASAALIEEKITSVIEDRLAGTSGIERMESDSSDNESQIRLVFNQNVNFEKVLNNIRDKLSVVRRWLPTEADAPILATANSRSGQAMMILFSDSKHDSDWVSEYVKRNIEKNIQQVDGVGATGVYGGSYLALRINLDPEKLNNHHLTIQDIQQILLKNHLSLPGGQISSKTRNFTVITKAKLQSVDEFKNIPVKNEAGYILRLNDVADVSLSPGDGQFKAWVNDKQAILLSVSAQADSNLLDVSSDINKKLSDIRLNLPKSMTMQVAYDGADYIKASLHNVYESIGEAILLVVVILLLFIGAFRLAIIPIITIPLCLFGALALMWWLNFSINILTLLALVLAIGLVVDDAIVVVENVHRHLANGMTRLQATINGSKEIGFAIISMTCTLAAVYMPIGFASGMTGQLMKEFAYTLAGSVFISGFVALTLTPVMCAKLLNKNTEMGIYQQKIHSMFERINKRYKSILLWQLNHKLVFIGITVSLIGVGGYWLKQLKTELAPSEDMGFIYTGINVPNGSNNVYFDKQLKTVSKILAEVPEAENRLTMVFDSGGQAFLALKPWDERKRSQNDIVNELNQNFSKIPGASVFATGLPPLPAGGKGGGQENSAVNMVISINGTYDELNDLTEKLKDKLSSVPELENINSSLEMNSLQIPINIDRQKAAKLNVDVETIATTIQVYLSGLSVSHFDKGGEDYDVILQSDKQFRSDIHNLDKLMVTNHEGKQISLSGLISYDTEVGALSLPHYNRMRSAIMTASLKPGTTVGQAVAKLNELMPKILPVNAKYEWGGETKRFLDSSNQMMTILGLALIFIYLVLAAQFESFIDPFIILLTVPFSILGAVIALKLTGGTNNIYTQVGFVTLIGLVSKHGILITEFANQLKNQGMNKIDAVINGAMLRIRPILMTTVAIVAGSIPLILTTGAGSQARSQIGWTIVGGMLIGTLFSLFVVPFAYSLISRSELTPELIAE